MGLLSDGVEGTLQRTKSCAVGMQLPVLHGFIDGVAEYTISQEIGEVHVVYSLLIRGVFLRCQREIFVRKTPKPFGAEVSELKMVMKMFSLVRQSGFLAPKFLFMDSLVWNVKRFQDAAVLNLSLSESLSNQIRA